MDLVDTRDDVVGFLSCLQVLGSSGLAARTACLCICGITDKKHHRRYVAAHFYQHLLPLVRPDGCPWGRNIKSWNVKIFKDDLIEPAG
jgi:hypothetical protein